MRLRRLIRGSLVVYFALLGFALDGQATEITPGAFDTQAVVSGYIGSGNPSVFEPTLTSYEFSACAICSAPLFPYPIISANGSAQYGPSFSTATGMGQDATGIPFQSVIPGSSVTSTATAIPNGLDLSMAWAVDPSLSGFPRFTFQAGVAADAAFSDTIFVNIPSGPSGTFGFAMDPTVTGISGNPALQVIFSVYPVQGSQLLGGVTFNLACGPNVIGPDGSPQLCGSTFSQQVVVPITLNTGVGEFVISEELIANGGWTSGFGGPISGSDAVAGTGYVSIPDAAFGVITSASGQLYTGPNEGFPATTPEPCSLVLLGSGIAALGTCGRKRFKRI
jgi:hypothetical protein